MLISQLGFVVLFAFEPLVAARVLARHSVQTTESLLKKMVRRDDDYENALADVFMDDNDSLGDDSENIPDFVPGTNPVMWLQTLWMNIKVMTLKSIHQPILRIRIQVVMQ